MRIPRWKLVLPGVAALLAAGLALTASRANQATPAADRQADRDAIRAMMAQFTEAFQKGDAAAAAAFMTAEAEIIPDDGDPIKGRDAIQKAYAAHFAKSARPKIKLTVEEMRFMSRDTAIEDGTMTVTNDGESETHPYHILYAREDGKWLIAVIKEWPEDAEEMSDLGWLIGTWTAKQGDVETNNTYEWMGNKSFIKATISVKGKDKSFVATQIIGLNRATGEYRTWTFEQDGGVGEGSCSLDGHVWTFENTTILSDGNIVEATNILVPVDKDTITWQPVNLTFNGDSIGNLAPMKLTRVKK